MTRSKATITHLLCSVAVGGLIFALLWTVYYPDPYFLAAGGPGLFLILVGVDVVAGPALTAVVFNPTKKSLKMDMAIIIAMQIAVLVYGLHTMWQARPAFILAGVDRFFLVQASDLDQADLAEAKFDEFKSLPAGGPVLAGVIPPKRGEEQLQAIEMAARGRDVQYFPKFYVPYDGERTRLTRLGNQLTTLKPMLTPQLEAQLLGKIGADSLENAAAVWYPLDARRGSFTLVVSSLDASPITVLPVSPWDIIDPPSPSSPVLDQAPVATGVKGPNPPLEPPSDASTQASGPPKSDAEGQ